MSKKRICAMVLVMWVVCGVDLTGAASRKVRQGDAMPEFSVQDVAGKIYAYTPQSERAMMILFLSAKQESSFKAQTDLARILGQLSDSSRPMDVVIALDDPNAFTALTSLESKLTGRMIVILDQDHHLWGGFGAIAMPTVVIANPQGQVVCFEAGYGYSFARVVHAHVNEVLGLETDVTQASLNQVSTVSNNTQKAKLSRLMNAANMMATRGHYEAAISEMKKAEALDPNGVDTRVSLAKLYCKASKGKEALEALEDLQGESRSEKSKILLVSGWAYRLTGDLDSALKSLVGATEEAPGEAQAFYELGRVYELKGLKDEALKAYRRALDLLF